MASSVKEFVNSWKTGDECEEANEIAPCTLYKDRSSWAQKGKNGQEISAWTCDIHRIIKIYLFGVHVRQCICTNMPQVCLTGLGHNKNGWDRGS